MRVFVLLLLCLTFLPRSVVAEGWDGPYLQFEKTVVTGDHSFSLDSRYGSIELWRFPLSSDIPVSGLEAGWRWQLRDSPWHLGVLLGVKQGSMAGGLHYQMLSHNVGASLEYESTLQVSVGGQVGYAVSPQLLVYGELGLSVSDVTLWGKAHAFEYFVDESITGFVPSYFGAVGVSYQWPGGKTIGFEYQRSVSKLSGQFDYDIGATARTHSNQFAVTFGWQF